MGDAIREVHLYKICNLKIPPDYSFFFFFFLNKRSFALRSPDNSFKPELPI
jgi:hypothetical protein